MIGIFTKTFFTFYLLHNTYANSYIENFFFCLSYNPVHIYC